MAEEVVKLVGGEQASPSSQGDGGMDWQCDAPGPLPVDVIGHPPPPRSAIQRLGEARGSPRGPASSPHILCEVDTCPTTCSNVRSVRPWDAEKQPALGSPPSAGGQGLASMFSTAAAVLTLLIRLQIFLSITASCICIANPLTARCEVGGMVPLLHLRTSVGGPSRRTAAWSRPTSASIRRVPVALTPWNDGPRVSGDGPTPSRCGQ